MLILDTSESMAGEKLDKLKSDTIELVNDILSDANNQVALITFGSDSRIISEFTNNKDTLTTEINNLTVSGMTNYYQALINADTILKNYTRQDNHECIILFLTDGVPTSGTPSDVSQYEYMKQQYPYLSINAVQYELGEEVLEDLENISDEQFIADIETLNNILFEASVVPVTYDDFIITDYINNNYFEIETVEDIETTFGEARLEYENEVPKVIWNLEDLKSGREETITIDISLKDEYLNGGGTYPTNTKETVNYKISSTEETIESELTPILSDNYKVIYDGNAPGDCSVEGIPESETKSVFEVVGISDSVATCEGYEFKGWKVATNDVTKVNSDYFIMPESDVVLRAEWGTTSIVKSMDGTVSIRKPLYQIMADAAVLDNEASEFVTSSTGIKFSSISSDTNGKGVYEIASTSNDEYPIYYYRGAIDNNNVKFADFCWKMVRTTETGGVKLIYNGVPDSEGYCTNTTGTATQIGTSAFNPSSNSLAYNGYMYGKVYSDKTKNYIDGITGYIGSSYWYTYVGKLRTQKTILTEKWSLSSTNYYYSTSVTYNKETGMYTLVDAEQKIWSENYSNLTGYYTCFTTSTECSSVNYISKGYSTSYAYYLTLSGGETYESKKWIFGKSVTHDGTNYVLQETTEVSLGDWYTVYSTTRSNGYIYTCQSSSDTCETVSYYDATNSNRPYNPYLVNLTGGETYESITEDLTNNYKWLYGNDVSYDEETDTYTLIDTIGSSPMSWSSDRTSIGNGYHYTCFTTGNTCSDVNYIYYTANSDSPYYIVLTNEKNIDEAIANMKTSTKDGTNSTIKTAIDTWYAANMTGYTSMLEDTVWCNDRSFGKSYGWTKDGNANNYYLYYSVRERLSSNDQPSLECVNPEDRFTVSEENGNGDLTYPVSLLTADEIMYAGGRSSTNTTYYLYTNQYWWSLSPCYFDYKSATGFSVTSDGELESNFMSYTNGVRPAVSLKPGTKVDQGTGTSTDPYVVDESELVKYSIFITGNDDIQTNKTSAYPLSFVTLSSISGNYAVTAFKMNGTLIEGNTFVMPEGDVEITDIQVVEQVIIESEHNPYPNSLNKVVYGEKTFTGATSLTVTLEYQTQSTSYDWIYLYDSSGTAYGKYGGSTLTTKEITIPGDYVKVVFRTNSSVNSYYGFKATIVPNYD